jgi:pimeloyl-ACP methyl ester carboxylesterase
VANILTTALRRPETYRGLAREAYSTLACVARYPFGLVEAALRPGRPSGDTTLDTPVLLVHGFGHNRSGWMVLERRLRRAGFTSVHTWNYNPLRYNVPRLAEGLSRRVELLRALTGSEKVHVVGHSLGGVLLRWYVQELGGDATVVTAITIASPHEGTRLARYARGGTAGQLAPGSWLMRRLRDGAAASPVRWIAFYSNLDMLVQPAGSAMLRAPALRATNILAKDEGHLSILLSPVVTESVVAQLLAVEGVGTMAPMTALAPMTAPAPPGRRADEPPTTALGTAGG